MNKKADSSNTLWIVIGIILAIIVLGIGIVITIKTIETLNKQKDIVECNSIVGKGVCREKCEPEESVKIKLSACNINDKQLWCCINPYYESEDYGGNAEYRFEVYDIGIDPSQIKSGRCKEGKSWTYTCTGGSNIIVKMTVKNTGTHALDIFANPKVGSVYPKQGTAVNVKPDEEKILTISLDLEPKKTYQIWGAAKCNTGACKTEFGDEGIFDLNDEQYITLIIE
ncbi:MAG: hypothetical protein QXK76_00800 [Candidatus Woesearchaeota archaeon]